MVVVVVLVGVAELRNGAEPPSLLLQQQQHPPYDDVGGRYMGGDASTATLSFYDIIMVVMMVFTAFVGWDVVGLVESRRFRCGGAAVVLREK